MSREVTIGDFPPASASDVNGSTLVPVWPGITKAIRLDALASALSGSLSATGQQQVIDVTGPSFNAPSGGTIDATIPIQSALTNASGGLVLIPPRPGGFLTTGLNLGTAKGLIINGVLKTATNAPVVTLTADDQIVDGYGSIEGQAGIGSSTVGIDVNGFVNFDISVRRLYNLGEGVRIRNTSATGKGGKVRGVSALSCTFGFDSDTVGEYVQFIGCKGIGCTTGITIRGGNCALIGGDYNYNTNGIVLTAGSNDSHGMAVGVNANHNTSYALLTAAIANGFDFIGCHMYDGEVYLNGAQDVLFDGGIYSIINWRCAAAAVARVANALVLTVNGDGLVVSSDSVLVFDACRRAGGLSLPAARSYRGGYVNASPPAASQSIPNGATTTLLFSALTSDRAGNSQSVGAGPNPSATTFLNNLTGAFIHRGYGDGKIDVELMCKLTGVGASPDQLYLNIKKNGAIVHAFITARTMVVSGTTYSIFNWSGRMVADVGDNFTFEIFNNTGSAMTLVNSDTVCRVEGL